MTQLISFVYDPQRQGLDTDLWNVLSGSVTTGFFVFADADGSDSDVDVAYESLSLLDAVTVTVS